MVDETVATMRATLVAEHERHIAEAQRRADEAAERGDEWYRKWHQGDADRLRALAYPWQSHAA
jgi:hypothetical protein